MAMALALAARGLGSTWPNPAVGCVLVRDGVVVGRGWTQPGGRPHAETEALARAGDRARGASAYVSLEPCSHHGRTAPCADALVAAGVARVVAAMEDPDPRVSGRGLARLAEAGIAVDTGVCAAEAAALNLGFLTRLRAGRPAVTLKVAASLDGRIATASGESRWITGPAARARAHRLRASHDAILVGSGTVLADDPELTCRLPGLAGRSPVRVVLDGRLRLPPEGRLARTARQVPVWCFTVPGRDGSALRAAGVEVVEVAAGPDDGHPDVGAVLRALAERGITRVLAEGGAAVAAGLLRAGVVDRVAWFRAPLLVGGDGRAAIDALGLARLADAPAYETVAQLSCPPDLLETFAPHG